MKSARIVLCCLADELDRERTVLRELVLPRLQSMLRRRSIELEVAVIAAESADPGGVGLVDDLTALAEPGTFTLCVLGRRYGPVLATLPEEVERSYWHLVPYASRSRLELICRQLLTSPGGSVAIFAFREPRPGPPPAEAPPAAGLLALLKRAIRQSGATVLEPEPDPAAGLVPDESLGEFQTEVLAALWQAIVSRESELPEPATPLYLDDNVQFTVYRAKAMRPDEWYPLLAFAHLSERRPDAPEDAPDPIAEVERQARGVLGSRLADFDAPRVDSRAAVPRDGEITFLPQVPGVVFNPERQLFSWREDVHRTEFRMRAGSELAGRTVRGRMSVYLGAIILAEMDLAFRIDPGAGPAAALTMTEPAEHARPYRKIFASYSHRDTEIVRQFELLARSLGDRYLRDVMQLRSGDDWDQGLLELINEADVFQLFWSSNSMASPHVRREWEYAMSLRRPHFIRPTYWEDPLPSTQDPILPPDSLRALHFHQIGAGSGSAGPALPASHLLPTGYPPPPTASTASAPPVPAPESRPQVASAPVPTGSAYAATVPTGSAAAATSTPIPPGWSSPPTATPPPPSGDAPRPRPRGKPKLRALFMGLALAVVAGATLTAVVSQRAGGPSIVGGERPASVTRPVQTPGNPAPTTAPPPAQTSEGSASATSTSTHTEGSASATATSTNTHGSASATGSSTNTEGSASATATSIAEGARPSTMRVDDAQLTSGPAESRPGPVTSVYAVSAGQQIGIVVSFVSTSREPVPVTISAGVTCTNAEGKQLTATARQSVVEVPVDEAADPGHTTVTTWRSESITVPSECVHNPQARTYDGAIFTVGTSPGNPAGTQIVTAFNLD